MNKIAFTQGYLNKEAISLGRIAKAFGGGSKFRFAGRARDKAKTLQRKTDQKTIWWLFMPQIEKIDQSLWL